MENEGIRADGIKLKEYGDKLAVSITELERKYMRQQVKSLI